MFRKLLALIVAATMVLSIIPASSFAASAEAPPAVSQKAPKAEPDPTPNAANGGEGIQQINTGHIAIDNNPSGGYTGNYVVIYNPSESSSDSKSTGNMSGRIQTSISANMLPGDAEDELIGSDGMYIIDVDAEMEELAEKLYGEKYEAPEPVRQSFNVGDERDFTVPAYSPTGSTTVRFKVLRKTDHCYIWTITSTASGMYPLSSADAQSAANEFEAKYALMNSSFGTHNTGYNGDGRVHILYYNIQDNWNGGGYVGGYFTNANYSSDGLPVLHIDTYPSIYYNNRSVADTYNTVVHEYQHMIHRSRVGISETWINECMSAAAEELCYPGSSIFSRIMTYTNCPWMSGAITNPAREYATVHENLHKGYSMYAWDNNLSDVLALYAQVSLFSQYMFTHYPNGNDVFNAILTELASGRTFQQACPTVFGMSASRLVRDFRITMTANSTQNVLSGRYRFALQNGYNPSEYYGIQNPYSILGPIIFTENTCSIKGGGSITVKPVNGVYNPPAGADPGLEYYGITLNAAADAPPVEPTPTPAPKIYSVEILDFEAPTWGATPNDTLNVPNGAHYSISLTRWRYRPANSNLALPMSPSMTFNDPTLQYDMIIYVQAEDGYVFHTSTSGAFTVVFDEMQTFDFNSTTELFISTRLFSVVEPDPTPMPTEAPPATSIWDFESDPIVQGFEFRDQDGDGYNWTWKYTDTAIFNHHEGSGLVTSASYDNTAGVLTPDNWLITPVFTGTSLSFWAQGQDAAWAEEYLGIFVSTNGGSTWSSELAGFTLNGEDNQYFVDLSAYEGLSIRLAIRHYNVSDMYTANVDYIEVRGGELPSLDEALNVTGGNLHFESAGDYPWIVVVDGDRICAKSGNEGVHSSDSVLTTVINANDGDIVSFEFKAWGEGTSTYWDYCEFAIDGERLGYWGAYQNDWETFTTEPLTAGEHTLTWNYHKDSSVNKDGDCFSIDNVEYIPYIPTLDEALNAPGGNLHFESEGTYPWLTVVDGDRIYARSGNAGVHSSDSVLSAVINTNEGDIVSFEFKAWGEGSSTLYDKCQFLVDGVVQAQWGSYRNEEWETCSSAPLSAGEHTLTWAYTKDSSVNNSGDCFMVDNVEIIGSAGPIVIDTIELFGFTVPAFGEHPDFDVYVPDDAPYTLTLVAWGNGLTPDSVFTSGVTHYAKFEVEAHEGYIFSDFIANTTVLINSSSELYDRYYSSVLDGGRVFHFETIDFVIEDPGNIITHVDVLDLVIPAWGASPVYTVSVPEGANYSVNRVEWFANNAFYLINNYPDALFNDPNELYEATVVLTADEGYEFAEAVTATINGEQILVKFTEDYYGELLVVSVGFAVEVPTDLDEALNVTNGTLHFESTGDYPWIVATENGTLYAKSGNAGAASSSSSISTTITSNGLTVVGFSFKAWGEGTDSLFDICQFLIDGDVQAQWGAYRNDEWEFFSTDPLPAGQHILTWTYTKDDSINEIGDCFMLDDVMLGQSLLPPISSPPVTETPQNAINEIDIHDFVEPTWGAAPNYGVSVPEDAHYTIENVIWLSSNGIMQSWDTFSDPTVQYYILVEVVPEEGYFFDRYGQGVVAAINGEEALAYGPHYLTADRVHIYSIPYSVYAPQESQPPVTYPPEYQIDTIELNGFVEPVWGAAPSYSVTVPEGANYTITEQGWYYYAGVMAPLHDGDLFNVEGRRYSMIFMVAPAEGYSFVNEPTVIINGREDLSDFCIVFGVGDHARIDTIEFTVHDPAASLLGDVDGDGEVTIMDAILTVRQVLAFSEFTEEQIAVADVDGDGAVTITDCLLIMRYALGTLESFPAQSS